MPIDIVIWWVCDISAQGLRLLSCTEGLCWIIYLCFIIGVIAFRLNLWLQVTMTTRNSDSAFYICVRSFFLFFFFFAPAHLLKLLLRLVICTCARTAGFLSCSCIASPVLLFILGSGLRRGQVIAAEPCTQVPLRVDVILVWISLKEVVLRRISGRLLIVKYPFMILDMVRLCWLS